MTKATKVASEEKKLWAEECLREKSKELGRLPKMSDFDDITRSRIKAFLGPWPRALESAGLKEAKPKVTKKKKRSKSAKTSRITALRKIERQRMLNEKEKTEN